MKLAQTEKLYSKLSPIEQGNLSFEAIVRRDYTELDAISSAVNRFNYTMADITFCHRTRALTNLAFTFGLSYWKNSTRLLQSGKLGNQKASLFYFDEIAAMDAALIAVCKQLNVEVNAVRTLASIENEPNAAEFANPEIVSRWIEDLMELFK